MEFKPMPKIPRLSREIVITEKLDGTNASIWISELDEKTRYTEDVIGAFNGYIIRAGSRQRWITPEDDNYGFAKWVKANALDLVNLGPGHHFGEWWGNGIQRGYGLKEKRFSLFNVKRWINQHNLNGPKTGATELAPKCCHVVPVLYQGFFSTVVAEGVIADLIMNGSEAAPGFMDPEGIIVYHDAAQQLFKKTCKHDEVPKNATPPRERKVQEHKPKDPTTGGRRKGCEGYTGPERRKQ